MQVNKFLIGVAILVGCGSCIEPFEPELKESQEVIVISGVITDQPGVHTVEISLSSPYNDPSFVPLSGCIVTVMDERGDTRFYQESVPGIYEALLPASYLAVGKAYSLAVITPDESVYQSDYDTLLACPPVDSLYFEVMSQATRDPDETLYGIQFYSDMAVTSGTAGSYRWVLEETWEYKSPYTGTYIWFGGDSIFLLLADTVSTCYMTEPIRNIYTATTRSLSVNGLRHNPLSNVSNETPRLKFKYSLLVEQQSLSGGAFEYWDRLKSMVSGTGGLYETQPPVTTGNIYNTEDPDERVLGYFYATQSTERRINVENHHDFFIPNFTCKLDTFANLQEVQDAFLGYPNYLFSSDPEAPLPPFLSTSTKCFDCTLKGGTNKEPEFWQP
jgi:hypothetical protein